MLTRPSSNSSLTRYEFPPDYLRANLQKLPSPLVYDVGAGEGSMEAPMESLGLAWQGFDLFPASPEIQKWDLNQPCPVLGAKAGAVLLLDVIEHLTNPGLGLKNIAATMLPGAKLIISTPNPRWSRSRSHALFHGYLGCFTQADLDNNHHVFPAWPHILEKMLHDEGLAVETYVTLDGKTEWPDHPISLRYPARLLRTLALKAIERADPSACGMSYCIVAVKTAA